MSEARIQVKPEPGNRHRADVYRVVGYKRTLLGRVLRMGDRYYIVRRTDAGFTPGAYWFTQLTSAVQYLITNEPNDNGRMVVERREDYVADRTPLI